ncbi:hypothetical protein [Halorientalis salina]|uniref:hypothetical protein n=1 Tax=Halorientalis salina TaxID=2932266 RepID=UPI0020229F6E|nr:hypothetical protein [Halorientalis salina]
MIEAAFTSREKTLMLWLIHEGYQDPSNPPASHTTAINRSAEVGLLTEEIASRLTELWTNNRAQTYYQTGKATRERATTMLELATDIHSQIINRAGVTHECVCE